MLRMIDEFYGDKDGKISEDEWVRAMVDIFQGDDDAKLKAECETLSEVLHKNQRSEWRKRYRNKDAANLVIGARAAGVTHFVLVRHGNAGQLPSTKPGQPHGWGMDDRGRTLTNRGQAQCVAARAAWFSKCPVRPTVVCRCAGRAHTATVAAHGPKKAGPHTLMHSARNPTRLPHARNPCDRHVGAPAHATPPPCASQQYLDTEGGETAFGRYAQAVSGELAIKFRLSPLMGETGTYIAVFGHAVWLNAIAYAIATAAVRATPFDRRTVVEPQCAFTVCVAFVDAVASCTVDPCVVLRLVSNPCSALSSRPQGLSDEELDFLLDLELGECEAIHVPLYASDFGGKVQKMVVPL